MIGFFVAAAMACTPNAFSWSTNCSGDIKFATIDAFDVSAAEGQINNDWSQAGIGFSANHWSLEDLPIETLLIAGRAAQACRGSLTFDEGTQRRTIEFNALKNDSAFDIARQLATAARIGVIDYYSDAALIVAQPGRSLKLGSFVQDCGVAAKLLPVNLDDGAWLYEITAVIGYHHASMASRPKSITVWVLPEKIQKCGGPEIKGLAGALLAISGVWDGSVAVFEGDNANQSGRWASHEIGHLLLATPCHVKHALKNLMHVNPSWNTCKIDEAQAKRARDQVKDWGWKCDAASDASVSLVDGESPQGRPEVGAQESLTADFRDLAREAELRYLAEILLFAWNPVTRQSRFCEPDVAARLDVVWARERWREIAENEATRKGVESYIEGLRPSELRDYFKEFFLH